MGQLLKGLFYASEGKLVKETAFDYLKCKPERRRNKIKKALKCFIPSPTDVSH